MKPAVVFLHGLGRTKRSLAGLRRHVAGAGYETWARTYPSRKGGIEALADRLARDITGALGETPVVGITHSLGGILARHIGDRVNWDGLLMLAPPNAGSRVAAALQNHPLYCWLMGPSLPELADPDGWPPPPRPFAVIAGTQGPTLGNLPSWLIRSRGLIPPGEPSDGTVTVAETRLPGMADFAEVPASHTWLMNHPLTWELALEFLERRRFGGAGKS